MNAPPIPEWCEAAPDAAFSPPGDCAKRATSFERRIWLRNIIEYAAGALVLVLFGSSAIAAFWKGETLIGLALALTVAGTVFVMWSLYKRGSNLDRRPEDPCIMHLRRQYERQRDALRSVPKWYLGPLIPGVAMLYTVVTLKGAQAAGWNAALSMASGPVLGTIAFFGFVAALNLWGARSLQHKIDGLDTLS